MRQNGGLKFDGNEREENIRFLYEKAIEARNFHYDNFTKWQTFFYVAVGSILVAYCTALFDSSGCSSNEGVVAELKGLVKVLLPILGYVFSLLWVCSSKGYTYWWGAYMKSLLCFEGENILGWKYRADGTLQDDQSLPGRYAVYNSPKLKPCSGIFNPFSGANFSTSKIANAMAFASASAWGSVLMVSILGANGISPYMWVLVFLSPILFTWIVSIPIARFFFGSDIPKHMKEVGCDAECVVFNGCLVVFAHFLVLSLILLFCFCLLKPSSWCCESVLACVEIWLFLSIGLFTALRKSFNSRGGCKCI